MVSKISQISPQEVKQPTRNLPRAIIYSIIITTVLYCLTAISVVSIIPFDEIDPQAPLNDVATAVLGPIGGIIMSLIALFATVNTVLIMMIVTSRMMYGMARDKALPEGLSKVSTKFKTPALAVLVTMILTIIPLFLGDIRIVADATVFGVLITFFLVNLSLIVLRKKKPELERPFKQKPNIRWFPISCTLRLHCMFWTTLNICRFKRFNDNNYSRCYCHMWNNSFLCDEIKNRDKC